MEMNFASKGVGAAALTTGIIGTAGVALNLLNGGLGNVLGGNAHKQECPAPAPSAADAMIPALVSSMLVNGASRASAVCNEDHVVDRYEAALQGRIAELETEVKLRDANIYTDSKIADVYERLSTRIGVVESQICNQAVVNAQITANIACMQNSIAALQGLTKTVIPIGNVCPEPMPAYNSWTAPTTPTTTG